MNKIKVLIIDDSAVIRKTLSEILSSDPEIEVVGTVVDAVFAMRRIENSNPDVLTLDVNMPHMDGITFLKELMKKRPMPVVMVSTETKEGGTATLKALESGAVDYVTKPSNIKLIDTKIFSQKLIEKVKIAYQVRDKASLLAKRHLTQKAPPVKKEITKINKTYPDLKTLPEEQSKRIAGYPAGKTLTGDSLVAIGASTGGTEAIKEILTRIYSPIPPIVIVQHMPPHFTDAFAQRLNSFCDFEVREANDKDELHPNLVLIAPGGFQMVVRKKAGGAKYVEVIDTEPFNRHKPSVDVLFNSIAHYIGGNSLGVILTGMGADGADGLVRMRQAGSETIAQNKETSIIFGMPAVAIEKGGAGLVMPLLDIGPHLQRKFKVK